MGTFTYENQGTYTFLIYTADSEEETDNVAVGMTANNKMEGIISPGIQQKNMKMVYKYNITSLTALEDVLLSVLNEKKLVHLLESMTKSILYSQQYLLTEENFLLDTAHIYVRAASGEASLIVSPVVKTGGISFQNFIKEILNSVISDEAEDCSYIVKIRNYINRRDGFSYEGFLNILGKLGSSNNSVYSRADIQENQMMASVVQTNYAGISEKPEISTPVQPQQQAEADFAGIHIPAEKQTDLVSDNKNVASEAAKPEKEKGFGFGKLFGKKERAASETKEKNSPLNFAYPGKTDSHVRVSGIPSMAIPGRNNRSISQMDESQQQKKPIAQDSSPLVQKENVQQSVEQNSSASGEKIKSHVEEDYGNTIMMADDDEAATVLLFSENSLLSDIGSVGTKVYITRVKNQQKMEIAKQMFKIGRSADTADFYVAGNGMVGREHAFILTEGGKVFIKDNNSMNHTYVNDVMVNAGERVELKNQDIIRLADEIFEITIQ